MFRNKIIVALLVLIASVANAQKDSIVNTGDETVIVVKDYVPTLIDANKISDAPSADTTSIFTPVFKYDVDVKKYNTVFTSTPIKPVRIKDDNIKKLYRGFIKGGYGTHNTPYAEVFYNALRSKEFNAGFHYRHLSSMGKIKNYGDTDNSNNGFSLFGKKFIDAGILSAELDFERNVVHYYGFDRREIIFSKRETKQRFADIAGKIDFTNNNTDKNNWDFGLGLAFNNYTAKRHADKTSETGFNLNGNLGKYFNENYANLNLNVEYNKTEQPDGIYQSGDFPNPVNNLVFKLHPRYKIKVYDFDLTVGVNFEAESVEESKMHLYPFAEARYKVAQDVLSIYGSVSGGVIKNSYKSITSENPFTTNFIFPGNSNNKLEFKAGTDIKLDKEISFNGYISFSRVTDKLFFYNIPREGTEYVTFINLYDDADILKLHGGLQFLQSDKMQLGLYATYQNIKPDEFAKPWYVPTFTTGLTGNYTMQDKIIVKADLFFNGSQFAPDEAGEKEFVKLDGWIDANLCVEYRHSKLLSVFAQVNNIASQQYFRWYNYPSYRFSAMGGFTYSF